MTEGAQIAVIVLLAVLVGAALPVLYQLQRTLRSARILLSNADQRLDRILAEISETKGRLDGVIARADRDLEGLRPLIDAAAGIGRTAGHIQSALRPLAALGGAVGPAIVAAARAVFAPEPVATGAEAPAEPEPEVPHRPRDLTPGPAPIQVKEVAHHHE